MSQVKISVVSGSRAEFGQLLPLLLKLQKDNYFDLDFVVTGSHLWSVSGYTLGEVKNYPLKISEQIEIPNIEDNTPDGIGKQIGTIIQLFTEYYCNNRPDILIVTGDRYEMFGVGVAACTLQIPMVHLCGGSVTTGAIDDVYRHSLTKMSQFHFVTCEVYRRRVIQLGESPENVYNVGSLAIENCYNAEKLSEEEIRKDIGMPQRGKYCVVTYHPVTMEGGHEEDEIEALIQALDSFTEYMYIITLANVDAGGNKINDLWREAAKEHKNFYVVPSLGVKRYLSALKYAEMMIGNSSSGTTEGPALHIPTVDIGDRQQGRYFAESVVHCDSNKGSIQNAIRYAGSSEFREKVKQVQNPFGDGTTSQQMVHLLKQITSKSIDVKKTFYDIDIGDDI